MTNSQTNNRAVEENANGPQPGDWIEVDASERTARRGEILEVLGEGSHQHFRVRWDEEHISLFYPTDRRFVIHSRAARDQSNSAQRHIA